MIPIADTRQLEVNGVIELFEITYGAQTVRICNDESDTGYVSWGLIPVSQYYSKVSSYPVLVSYPIQQYQFPTYPRLCV